MALANAIFLDASNNSNIITMLRGFSISLILVALFFQFSCTHDNPFPRPVDDAVGGIESPPDGETGGVQPGNDNKPACDPDSVYFANQILPIFIGSCAVVGCHDQTSKADGISLVSYSDIMKGIKAGDPEDSEFFEVISDSSSDDLMPIDPQTGEGFSLPASQIALIEQWINQNAPDNACADCDSSVYNFSGPIMAIIATSCATSIGCHASGSSFGAFTSYENIRPYADNGSLLDRVILKMDMPIAAPLPDCDMDLFRRWLEDGAPNN